AQAEVILRGPGTDQLQRPQARCLIPAATQSLAVDGNVLPSQRLLQRPRPIPEAAGERIWVQAGEDTLERVMRGSPVGQGEELLQPLQAPAGEGLDLRPGVRPTDHRADGNDDQVHQQVTLAALAAWVAKMGEVFVDGEI